MSMNIQEHLELASFLRHLLREVVFHESPKKLDFSQSHFGLGVVISEEASVHVLALGVASVVTRYNSVRINHG